MDGYTLQWKMYFLHFIIDNSQIFLFISMKEWT